MTSAISLPQTFDALLAQDPLDGIDNVRFPRPLGPTTAVMPEEKTSRVLSAALKPTSSGLKHERLGDEASMG